MFEEAQLYSPVTRGEEGVGVHLGGDHPGANDPEYRARRGEIAEAALGWLPGETAPPNASTAGGRSPGSLGSRRPRSHTPRRSSTSGAPSPASSRPSTSATPAGPSATPTQ